MFPLFKHLHLKNPSLAPGMFKSSDNNDSSSNNNSNNHYSSSSFLNSKSGYKIYIHSPGQEINTVAQVVKVSLGKIILALTFVLTSKFQFWRDKQGIMDSLHRI